MTRGRGLVRSGAVKPQLAGDVITGRMDDRGIGCTATLKPALRSGRVVFERRTCSCKGDACVHQAAAALAALDRFPALRRAEQTDFFAALVAPDPGSEKSRTIFMVGPADPPDACIVSITMVGERSGVIRTATPKQIAMDTAASDSIRALGRILGGGEATHTAIPAAGLDDALSALLASQQAQWAATGKRLLPGQPRTFDTNSPPPLSEKSAVLVGSGGAWYVDAASGAVGRIHLRQAKPPPAVVPPPAQKRGSVPAAPVISDQVIVERPMTPFLQLTKLQCPDDFGRMRVVQALKLDFDYDGVLVEGQDERQFVRVEGPAGPSFVRRDRDAETVALQALREDNFVQMRVSDGGAAKGRRVFVFHGSEAETRWNRFVAIRLPALQSLGWRTQVDAGFGPRLTEFVGEWDVRVGDADPGNFSLEFGIDIDGVREPLLPILSRIVEQGGIEAGNVIGSDVIASLPDGRLVKLPLARIQPLLAIMSDLIEAAGRLTRNELILPQGEATTVLELEDFLSTRWENAAAIEAYAQRFRVEAEIAPVEIPAAFTATLRPYQQQGVSWLQHLGAHGLNGFLADDMGLGKTAQTIAHLVVEEAAGRLDRPALIVVPTSLITNWTAELTKFAPHFRVAVLHGLNRHERRDQLDGIQVVITTYAVLTRDIEPMKTLRWHLVVLDEAQAIKSPDAKATRAVCQLETRHRLCLSGTPIENNLDELWSQFAFLMPGLLGNRRSFTKRFRTPIEKKGNNERRTQLVRRIKPFILRRTKSEVATELPPKHTILRRITLAPAQREMYETIRATLYEKVRAEIAEHSLAGSRIVVLDALLKLRQACCDPRLVKLASAAQVTVSSKLDDLMEMVSEMIREGRRILLFSQFTSMLDLIKPNMAKAGIPFVELRGDTRDRAEPVRAFQALEVPLFLISLKAGGRGLNLTAADTVIHYDPWWNPAVENQASDRAYRIGQTKSVFVYKMIAANTVEERIVELQQCKADLANIAFDETSEIGKMDTADIDYLFGSSAEKEP